MQNLDEIYAMLIENCGNPQTRFHPTAGDFSFLVNFEEELDDFKNKAFQWRDSENKLAGIAWPDYRGTYYISTRQTNPDIYEIILQDIEAGLPEDKEIWIWSCETDTIGQTVLQQRKYSTNGWYMFYGHKSLVEFTPEIIIPDGYSIRELADHDLPAKVELMGVSMGENISRTIEKYHNMQKSMVYNNKTDLVIIDSKNMVVAFCNGWFDRKNNMGVIEPCGTSEEHAKKGLMTCLMNHLFNVYKQNGINDIYQPHGGLCTYEDENDDAMRLYKKLGFREEYKMFIRIKNYDPAKHDEFENQAHFDFSKSGKIKLFGE
jgi:N-acetylglutamate synthase-like GNAT family acetyltransferase